MARLSKQNKTTETVPEEAQQSEFLDQDPKMNILNMFKELKLNTDKELKEIRKMIHEQNENIKKGIKHITKEQNGNSRSEEYNN